MIYAIAAVLWGLCMCALTARFDNGGPRRMALFLATHLPLLALATIAVVSWWKEMRWTDNELDGNPIFIGLALDDTRSSVESLRAGGFSPRCNLDSTAIFVPADRVAEARAHLVARLLPRSGWLTVLRDPRAIERQLEETLRAFAAIHAAYAHIVEDDSTRSLLVSIESTAENEVADHLDAVRHLAFRSVESVSPGDIVIRVDDRLSASSPSPNSAVRAWLDSPVRRERVAERNLLAAIEHAAFATVHEIEPPDAENLGRRSILVAVDDEVDESARSSVVAQLRRAVRFDKARGDELTVTWVAFDQTRLVQTEEESRQMSRRDFWTSIAINVAKSIGVLAGLFTYLLIVRTIRSDRILASD